MILSFARPELLLVLPAVLALLWLSARVSYADLSGWRRPVAWALRGLLVAALVAALAGARWMKAAPGVQVVFIADQSASIAAAERLRALRVIREALAHRRAHDGAALVVCGHEALVESEQLATPGDVQVRSTLSDTHTNLAAALRLALGLVPAERGGRIVLLSDGNENLGDAGSEALVARSNGVTVDVVPLQTESRSDVVVRDLLLPAEARRREPLAAQVSVSANRPTGATLRVLVNDQPVSSRAVTLAAGNNLLKLPLALAEPGFHKIEIVLEAPGETCRANDVATAFVRVRGQPRVLLVDRDPANVAPLRQALAGQDIELVVGGPTSLPLCATDLEQYDALILSDIPAYQMTHRQMCLIRSMVRDQGLGLGMIGGEYSFGPGGYFDSPVEEALPVKMDLRKDRQYAASSTIIVMDTSGSMAMTEDGVEKIQLAAEASCAVAQLLNPYDALGLLVSDPAPTLVCPIQRVSNRSAIEQKIRSVRAGGGGICVTPSLRAAHAELSRIKSPVRHVILLADGSDCDDQEGSVKLVQQMSAENITLSAVAFGDGPHVPFLKDVVAAGRGQFYLTSSGRDLKGIFTREVLTMEKAAVIEEPFVPRLRDSSPVLRGLPAMPPLLGYVAATIKPRATQPLLTHKADPLFAHWQYGLGRAFAFTSDAGPHWAVRWMAWEGFPKFWAQTVRWVLRELSPGDLHPEIMLRGDQAHLRVLAVQNETRLNGLEVRALLRAPDDETTAVVLPQTGPGRYEGDVPVDQIGAYLCTLTAAGPRGYSSRQVSGFAIPYPPDLADTTANRALLTSLARTTGGRELQRPGDAFRPPARVPRTPVDITGWLLWLAALLLPLDVAARRLALRREDIEMTWAWVRARLVVLRPQRAPAAVPAQATMDALLSRKEEVRERTARAAAPNAAVPEETLATAVGERRADRPVEPPDLMPRSDPQSTTSRLLERKRRGDSRDEPSGP